MNLLSTHRIVTHDRQRAIICFLEDTNGDVKVVLGEAQAPAEESDPGLAAPPIAPAGGEVA